ncbi:hypothetical protein C1645_823795 [Glomus cerebriforme]|uniref:Uncharacterized protein n=1 Tax=Glomus cerebriforme TaxID=658196 RepID=A0A397SV88_9GLOM|nr:hypothetical protein C1645_823795 [Glomus cerebriforme]
MPSVCPFSDCGKNIGIIELTIGTSSTKQDSSLSQSSEISALSNMMSKRFVLSLPTTQMEGIKKTAIQRNKSYLRCAKCSKNLFSYLSPLSFYPISTNSPMKPLQEKEDKKLLTNIPDFGEVLEELNASDASSNTRKFLHFSVMIDQAEEDAIWNIINRYFDFAFAIQGIKIQL